MRARWMVAWVLSAGACLGASASLPAEHWLRPWLALPAGVPLLVAWLAMVAAVCVLSLAWLSAPARRRADRKGQRYRAQPGGNFGGMRK